MPIPEIDTEYLMTTLTTLLNTPSPTGYAQGAIAAVEEALRQFPGLELNRTRKGALVAT